MNGKTLIAVVGPTAIGKTRAGILLAEHFGTEIISADSRQFFKEMRIGTAVPEPEELARVPHHFIQHIHITDPYSVGDFERDALERLNTLFTSHDVVVMVGGSGLYVDAVRKGLDTFPDVDPTIRQELNQILDTQGLAVLQERLQAHDPEYFERVDHRNPHRVIRALEVCMASGKPYSYFLDRERPPRPFSTLTIQLEADRAVIYDRIERRVDLMMAEGLLEEARGLYPYRDQNALQTVGYRELFDHFDGNGTLEEAISEIKKNTRRFAKRQLTWYRKDPETNLLAYDTPAADMIARVRQWMKM